MVHVKLEKSQRATAGFSVAIQINPDFVEARYGRGPPFKGLAKYQEANGEFSDMLARLPDYCKAYLERVLFHIFFWNF